MSHRSTNNEAAAQLFHTQLKRSAEVLSASTASHQAASLQDLQPHSTVGGLRHGGPNQRLPWKLFHLKLR